MLSERIGLATVYCGDCRELLDGLSVGAVVSDPPYGIGLSGRFKRRIVGDHAQDVGQEVLTWAEKNNLTTLFFASPSKPWPGKWRNYLVWDKGGGVGGGGDIKTTWKKTWELIQVTRNGPLSGGRDVSVLRFTVSPLHGSALHPAQKPVDLMIYLIEKATSGVVFDPFSGSGSTGVAAVKIGREFIGVEIDKKYYSVMCQRLEESQKQGIIQFAAG